MALPIWHRRTYGDHMSEHHRAYLQALDAALDCVIINAAFDRVMGKLSNRLGELIASFDLMGNAFVDAGHAVGHFYDALPTDCDCDECLAEETWN